MKKSGNTGDGSDSRGRLRSVTGRHNAQVKELRKAFAAGGTASDGLCAIEGLRILEEAIRSGMKFQTVFFSDSAKAKAERLLPQIGAHVETLLLPDALFAGVVPSASPQGVAALVHYKIWSLDEVLAKSQSGPLLVIAGVQDPGNLGTILRSAEAFEAGGAILAEGTVSPWNPKVVRASAGSAFRFPAVQATLSDALEKLRGRRLIATSSHKGTPIHQADLTGPIAIFIGNEGAGLSRDVIAKMNEIVVVSHSSKVESLNAGVAASIVLYEAARQRGSSA